MSEHASELLQWAWAIVGVLMAVLWWFFRQERNGIYKRLDHLDCRMTGIEEEVKGVTLNYTKKFDEVHMALAKMQEILLERIHQLEISIVAKHPHTKRRS